MIPLAIAAPIVGSLASSVIGGAFTSSANSSNQKFALRQQQLQNEFNEKQQQRMMDYNNPAAQMARLRDAGINPNSIAGQAGASGNVAQPLRSADAQYRALPKQAPDLGAAAYQGLMAHNNLLVGQQQANALQAQANNAIADAALKGMQMGLARAGIGKTEAETNLINSTAPFQADLLKSQIDKNSAETSFRLADNERQAALTANTLKMSLIEAGKARIQNLEALARTTKIYAEIPRINAEIAQMQSNISKLATSTELDKLEIDLRKMGLTSHDNVILRSVGKFLNSGSLWDDASSRKHGVGDMLVPGLGAFPVLNQIFNRKR